MNLFLPGPFTSHSSVILPDKIDCDALADADWAAIAQWFFTRLPPFSHAIGIPSGGLKLAKAMQMYNSTQLPPVVLICDDVITTGKSMEEYKEKYAGDIGIALFSRTKSIPSWIKVRFIEQ